ncbi:septation protein IspZ [Gammaproteobacteria bacterium]|nr:septation protein IspZ [Gammaproteobacteria bacterium]
MNSLLKITENPLMPIAVIATVWYVTRDFLMLTAALMIMMTFQVIVEKLVKKEVSKLLFMSWCLVIPFGAMTLLLRDPVYLQWKFSIVHWLLGSILLASYLFKGPVFLKSFFLSTGLTLQEVPDESWRNVTYFISVSLLVVGTINLYFIYFADLATWVNFKIFGVTFLNIIIMFASFLYLFSKVPSSEKE